MSNQSTTVFGIYPSYASVEHGVDALRTAGFRSSDISVLFPENTGSKDSTREKGSKVQHGASTGGGTGAVVGGALGWLVGIGGLVVPGVGPFIAAGPILTTLAGAGVGGVVGEIAGALIGMGMPENAATRYESRVKDGNFLLSVGSDSSEWSQRAQEVLEMTGAQHVSSTSETNSKQIYDAPAIRKVA